MDHADRVGGGQARTDLGKQRAGPLPWEWAATNDCVDGMPDQPFHHEERSARAGETHIDDLHHVRVRDAANRSSFEQQPFRAGFMENSIGAGDFGRESATRTGMLDLPHGRGAAIPDPLEHTIAVTQVGKVRGRGLGWPTEQSCPDCIAHACQPLGVDTGRCLRRRWVVHVLHHALVTIDEVLDRDQCPGAGVRGGVVAMLVIGVSEANATVLLLAGLAACLPLPDAPVTCEDDGCGCPIYYWDLDGDGYGDEALAEEVCTEPWAGLVARGGDCYDGNADAFPLQERAFAVHRGDGSFDYDCSGGLGTLWPATQGICAGSIDCENLEVNPPGWIGTLPACGETGPWLEQCEYHFFLEPRCLGETVRERRAACR